MTHPRVQPDPAFGLLKLYDDALPHVYGYLLVRARAAFRRIYEGEEGSR